ncbi:MAG: HEAT repeat domain-containing protein [Candidatus Alcyoniella australis]|nr:HEAT repeat domain-containing protein [Candidatus Alcyoniella australis]
MTAIRGAKTIVDQTTVMTKVLSDVPSRGLAEIFLYVADKATEDLSYAKVMLNLIDNGRFQEATDKKTFDQMVQGLRNSEKGKSLANLLERTGQVPKDKVNILRAKFTMYMQLLSLIAERAEEDGLPPLKVNAIDSVNTVLDNPDLLEKSFNVDLNWINRLQWNIAKSILEEADFRRKGVIYELVISDVAIKTNAAGVGLVKAGTQEAGGGGLSDVAVARMGQNIIRRVTLLVRMLGMYPMDHPSVEPAIETLVNTLDELLGERERITLSRVGSDILVDDVRIKRRSRFLDDFVAALDTRNINSVSFTKGVTLDEITVFIRIFAMTEAQVKKAGGAKGFLDKMHVSNITLDQFRYGVIAGEDERIQVQDARDSGDRLMSNVILSEIVGKMQGGTDMTELSAEKIGQAFKSLSQADVSSDPTARRYLMQMVLAMDPSLLDKTLFSEGGIRDELSWSTTRKMVEQLLQDIATSNFETKVAALDNILNMTDVAIAKNKDTTLVQVIDNLTGRLAGKEKDHEVVNKIFSTMGTLAQKLIISDRLMMAQRIVLGFDRLRRKHEAALNNDSDSLMDKVMVESSIKGLKSVADAETVQVMLRNLVEEDREHSEAVSRILRVLRSSEVIDGLFNMFSEDDRSIRRKAFTILSDMGAPALEASRWKIRELENGKIYKRTAQGMLSDQDYFIVRNAIDLVAKLGSGADVQTLADVKEDSDPRVRRTAVTALPALGPEVAAQIAGELLFDKQTEVSEAAALVLSKLRAHDQVPKLIEMFYAEPSMRKTLVASLAKLGGKEALEMLEPATHAALFERSNLVKIYREGPELRVAAIKGLGESGAAEELNGLKRLLRRYNMPLLRIVFVPLSLWRHRKAIVDATKDAIARMEYRLHGRK